MTTPMMRQYQEAKRACPDALLLFRMGDFYELFHDDAKTAARVLNLALTSREKGEDATPMAGFPHHQLESYLGKLITAGFRAAVCEQVEDPKLAKGLVRREVTRVVTPRHGDRRGPVGSPREQLPGRRVAGRSGRRGLGRDFHRPVRSDQFPRGAVDRPIGPDRAGRVPAGRRCSPAASPSRRAHDGHAPARLGLLARNGTAEPPEAFPHHGNGRIRVRRRSG